MKSPIVGLYKYRKNRVMEKEDEDSYGNVLIFCVVGSFEYVTQAEKIYLRCQNGDF